MMNIRLSKKLLATVIGLCAVIVAPAATATAQQKGKERSLVGVWRVTITPRNCSTGLPLPAPPFQGLYTFHDGGTMSEWIANANVLPGQRSPGHGLWQREQGWNEYSLAFVFLRYNASGAYTGRQESRGNILLSENGNEFTQNSSTAIFDPAGTVTITSCASVDGVRFE